MHLILLAFFFLQDELPPLSRDAAAYYERATAEPQPEFRAWMLLELARSEHVTEQRWKVRWLEEAWRAALESRTPVRLVRAPDIPADTREHFIARAHEARLDKLSLQSAVIESMTPLNPARARDMYADALPLVIPPSACADALVPEPGPLYEALAVLLAKGFTPAERKEGRPADLLRRTLASATSILQLPPIAQAIAAAPWTERDLPLVLSEWAAAFDRVNADPRQYDHVVTPLRAARESLNKLAASAGLNSDVVFRPLEALRERSRKIVPCESPATISALSATTAPADREKLRAKPHEFWRSNKAKEIFQQAQALVYDEARNLIRPEAKTTAEWLARVSNFRTAFDGWTASGEESEEDYYQQRAVILQLLYDIEADPQAKESARQALVHFILSHPLRRTKPMEWLYPLQRISSTELVLPRFEPRS